VRGEWALTTMVVSWAITEVIRYAHYTTGQLGLKPYALLWLRYGASSRRRSACLRTPAVTLGGIVLLFFA
jgi:hypothetical protein